MKNSKDSGGTSAAYIRMILLMILLTSLICAASACGSKDGSAESGEPVSGENYYLDTICNISIYEMKNEDGAAVPASEVRDAAENAIDKAWARCAELDKMLSRTNEISEIARINSAGGEWTEVSAGTAELVGYGRKYSELADGDFDITIGGVTELWNFHAEPEDARVPDADALAEAVRHVDYRGVEIDGTRVRLTDPDARIDLGGIAKGYIGDRLTEVLEGEGVTSAIINLGGNVICIGAKDNAAASAGGGEQGSTAGYFAIGVETPYSDRTEIAGRIMARDMTLVTSGVYERQIEAGGQIYHHVLDTKTGYSAETDLDAVTLTGPKGHSMDLDALSTICLIKGSEEAKKLIEKTDGVEAVFILHDGTTDLTSGMEFEPAE